MTDNEKTTLIETAQRSKNNEKRLLDVSADIKDIKEENKVMYQIASSIEVMALEMKNMAGQMTKFNIDISDVKQDVNNIGSKVDQMNTEINEVKNQDHKQKAKRWDDIKDKLIWVFLGGLATFVASQLISTVFVN